MVQGSPFDDQGRVDIEDQELLLLFSPLLCKRQDTR